jgi:hypothetical protein
MEPNEGIDLAASAFEPRVDRHDKDMNPPIFASCSRRFGRELVPHLRRIVCSLSTNFGTALKSF